MRAAQSTLKDALLPALRFDLPQEGPFDPRSLFSRPIDALWLEVGFGGGEHLAAQASAAPNTGIIGAEVFENGVVKLLAHIERLKLENVRLFIDDARLLMRALPEKSLSRVFILFPDPWPKLRHHKRRMVQRTTLDALARVMTDGAELRVATDDPDYLRAMIEVLTAHADFEWLARHPADWRNRPPDWPQTRYEKKALEAGRKPAFLRFRRRVR